MRRRAVLYPPLPHLCRLYTCCHPASPSSRGAGPPAQQALDNPDQRICDDVRSYTATSVALTIAIMRKLFNCVAFAGARAMCGRMWYCCTTTVALQH